MKYLYFVFCLLLTLLFAPSAHAQSQDICKAEDMASYVQRYGFLPKNEASYSFTNPLSPGSKSDFETLKQKATKYAPFAGVDPVLVVWWNYYEAGQDHKSYSYSHCGTGGANKYSLEVDCTHSAWQLGYGPQFGEYRAYLGKAFQDIYGDVNDKNKTKEVINKVVQQSGQQRKNVPDKSAQQLMNEAPSNSDSHYWLSVLMRDQDISAYILAQVIARDTSVSRAYKFGYSSYYFQTQQQASNLLNDVLLAWNDQNSQAAKSCGALDKRTGSNTPTSSRGKEDGSGNPEEAAVNNFCFNMTPFECDQPTVSRHEEPSIFQKIATELFGRLGQLFGSNPNDFNNLDVFYSNANINSDAIAPFKIEKKDDPAFNITTNLGVDPQNADQRVGLYSASTPNFKDSTGSNAAGGGKPIEQSECDYQQAYFPEGVPVITGQDC